MEKSFVFNSINGDRRYKAEDFASYFASFIGDGVFPNPSTGLQVIDNNDMSVAVQAGKGWIKGYFYQNTDDFILKVDVADSLLNRIDRVVLRLDYNKRAVNLFIKKGTFASSPVAPLLQRDADIYELGLADIYVRAGVISIIQSNITDLRLNKELCGIVHGTIDQVDTTTIFNQYLEWYKNITGKTEQELQNIKGNLETDFLLWFDGIKETLSGDVAGNLLNLINKNKDSIYTVQDNIDKLDSRLADMVTYQTAGGTATSINLNLPTLVNGYATTFIVSSNNNKNATTINGKKLYKPNTTTTPNLTAGKAVSVWYNATKDCFFIKASSEGTAVAANVLANKTFSNDNDTGLTGSMADRGAFNLNLGATVPAGYYSGGTVPKGRGYSTGDRTLRASRGNSLLPITGLSFTPSKVIVNTYYVNTRGYKQASYQITSNTSDMYNNYGRSIYGIFGYRGEGNPGQFSHDTTGTNIFGNGFNIILDDIYDSYDVVLRYWAFE
ncbi:hypothetical protein EXM52_16055 [Clostridium botulinum]|nr:hypothetical protein [Clostridium botulinum]